MPSTHLPPTPPSAESRAAEASRRATALAQAAVQQCSPTERIDALLSRLVAAAAEAAGYAAYAQSPGADAAYANWTEDRAAEAERLAAELDAELAKL